MKKNLLYSVLAALLLAVVAFLFFFPDAMEGNVLQQPDIQQGLANGQEGKAFHEATGETTRWTNSLFSGMPNFQIAPSYAANSMMDWIVKIYTLGLPSPANLLFAMMLGFFIMCLCMKMKWYESLFGAIAWGFSTYFIIIIGAGHIWKFITLSFIPPTIGGIILCYRGKYLYGTALTALFGALQLQGNHPQMTYYFLLPIFALVVAWLWVAYKEKKWKQWVFATLCCLGGGVLAVGANCASLYNTYEYSKETVRGRATDLKVADQASTEGMDRPAITAWSYGVDETMTLLIPNVKGGATIKPVAGQHEMLSMAMTDGVTNSYADPYEIQFLNQFPQYFGNQPMTNGPVYVGSFVLLLAILGMFTIRGKIESPMKWALFSAAVIAVLLSWGHNFAPLTNFMIDHFPGYNKFRAVASILVVVEFCVPLLAVMTLRQMIVEKEYFKTNPYTIWCVMGGGALICFIGWIYPAIFGTPFSVQEIEVFSEQGILTNPQYAPFVEALRKARLDMISADSLRSLIFIILGTVWMWIYAKGYIRRNIIFVGGLTLVVLIDLFSVNKRYVSSESFTPPAEAEETFNMTPADRQILQDTGNFRVLDLQGFSQARSSYFHKTIGGYHAAKLTRYEDLLKHNITRNGFGYLSAPLAEASQTGQLADSQALNVLNMLNTKYIINTPLSDSIPVIKNPNALGNAWFVDKITYLDDANAEMQALEKLDTRKNAVADKRFAEILQQASPVESGDTVYEVSYAPNKLEYKSKSKRGGIVVFSEIYFPWGWEATIDGQPVEIGRVNYLLRAIRVPQGTHNIVMTFNPKSLEVTNALSVSSVIMVYILMLLCIFYFAKRLGSKQENLTE